MTPYIFAPVFDIYKKKKNTKKKVLCFWKHTKQNSEWQKQNIKRIGVSEWWPHRSKWINSDSISHTGVGGFQD